MSETNIDIALRSATVAGGAAGDLTVTGIKVGDSLKTVLDVSAAGTNLASEFEITDDDTINNADGTDTTGMILLVQWIPTGTGGGYIDESVR